MLILNRHPADLVMKRTVVGPSHDGESCIAHVSEHANTTPVHYQKGSWLTGSEYTALTPVTKSDGSKPTHWKWQKIEIESPPFPFKMITYRPDDYTRGKACGAGYAYDIRSYEHGVIAFRLSSLKAAPPPGKNEKNDAMLKAQASIRRAAGSIPMIMAERKATVKTIKSYSIAILNNVITMQRKDVKRWIKAVQRHRNNKQRLARISKDIANRHLEFVFGVMPLIDDILGLTETFTSPRGTHRTGRGRQTTTTTETKSGTDYQYTYNYSSSVRVALRYRISNSKLNDASLLGFNPIYSWYDLTPLSFLVGFFSNANTFLQSLDPIPGLTFEHGYATHGRKTTIQAAITGRPKHPTTLVQFEASGRGSASLFIGERVPILKEPGVTPPRFKDNYGAFAALASASLAIQRLVKDAEREIARKPFRLKRRGKPRNLPPIKYVKISQ